MRAMRSKVGLWALRALVLAGMVAALVVAVTYRGDVERWASFGYPAVFLVCLVTNLAVLVPLPGFGITAVAGSLFNPWLVGLSAGLGQTIGDLNSYLAGYTSQVLLDDVPFYGRVRHWMDRRGLLTIFVLAALPNPFFSAAVVIAGASRMPLATFVAVTLAGKLLKSTVAALAGRYGIGLVRSLFGW